MHLIDEVKLDFSDVLIKPKRSILNSRKEVSLIRNFKFRNSKAEYLGIPIMAANMDGVGTFDMAEKLHLMNLFTCLTKHYKKEDLVDWINSIGILIKNNWAYSLGIGKEDLKKFESIYSKNDLNIKFVNIDVANGYSERFNYFISKFREKYPELIIIAGNVVTGEMTEQLLLSGADLIKVGIGSGAVCSTRIKSGIGYPQLSAVIECADAAHGLNGHIISDGGCTCPGDLAKAFAAGSDFVMLGTMLAGTDQGNGDIITKFRKTDYVNDTGAPIIKEEKYIQFYGMSSDSAMKKHYGKVNDYRSSEGRTVEIPYKGDIENIVSDILGGIRSTCSYVGAKELKSLSKCATLIKVNNTHNKTMEKYTI